MELTEIHVGEEREESAKSFLKRLSNEDDLVTAVSALDDAMDILVKHAMLIDAAEHGKNNDAISMIFFLNRTIDALKYIGTHDVLKPEV